MRGFETTSLFEPIGGEVGWSTSGLAPQEQYGFWADEVSGPAFHLELPDGHRGPYQASARVVALQEAAFAELRCDPLAVQRTGRTIAADSSDGFSVTLMRSGSGFVELDGEQQALAAGDLWLLDMSRPFLKRFAEPLHTHLLVMPRHLFEAAGVRLEEGLRVMAPRGGMADLFADFLISLSRNVGALQGDEPAKVARTGAQLMAAVFAPTPDHQRVVADSARALKAERVLRYVEQNVGDAALSPSRIAAALGTSVRYLHGLFEGTDASLGERILRRRLERCRDDLASPALARRGVGEIAYAWGFSNAAHFSRAFKAFTGMSPRDFRQRAAEARPPRLGSAVAAREPSSQGVLYGSAGSLPASTSSPSR